MKDAIRITKRLVSEMESYIYCDNYSKISQLTDELIDILSQIKAQCNNAGKLAKNNKENAIYPGFKLISTLQFLYKPILVKNYYEGDYLEKFGMRREEELKRANVFELHNKFWTSNNVEGGNVFGSIPLDLISREAAQKLSSFGWKETEVSVYEIGKEIDIRELDEFCSKTFSHYIIATEMRNNTILVLKYNII